MHDALLEGLPKGCVIDGEIVITTARGLDFDALQMTAASRRLARGEARATKRPRASSVRPARLRGRDRMAAPQSARGRVGS